MPPEPMPNWGRISDDSPTNPGRMGFHQWLSHDNFFEMNPILSRNGGRLTYTLDDPYIHLALSEGIAEGHYGIHPAEPSAPSSSIVWPFLLAPGARLPLHELLPLLLAA